MAETTLWLVGVLLLVGTTVLAAMWRSSKGRDNRLERVFSRVEARLDEQGRRTETLATGLDERGGRTEDIVRALDRELRQGQAAAAEALVARLGEAGRQQQKSIHELEQSQLRRIEELKQQLERRHMETYKSLNQTLQAGVDRVQQQMTQAVTRNGDELGKRMDKLTASTDKRLLDISGQVDKRLSEGFEKTVATFADVQKRLELIDHAQKKITELSGNVVSLQEVLADRTSRGTFGEVQLHALVKNVLPESSYGMQYTLSNGRCVDCMMFLPEPTGSVAIDSKFPLENFRRKVDPELSKSDREAAGKEFARNVLTHIQDVAKKYIIDGETADFAVLFIPAEAVFAEIHGRHPDLVEKAHRLGVIPASPTTLFAILTTAAAVLKDAATREQVHIIQEHLSRLGDDFNRFQTRMDNLAQHIDQAHRDVELVNTSARKITSRFSKIERLDLGAGDGPIEVEAPGPVEAPLPVEAPKRKGTAG